MTKTLYLHIGWGRCGSSSIQHFALKNRAELRKRGLWYPIAEDMGLPSTRGGNGQVLKAETAWRLRLEQVAASLAKAPDSKILLSSEFLCPLSAEYFRTVKRSFASRGIDVVCVAYVREQREWLMSRYAQAVKSRRWTMSLEEYLRERYHSSNLNYAQRFNTFAEVFGKDRVRARLFQRDGLSGGDVRLDLFGLMQVDVGDLICDEPNANASASIVEVETMRAVNSVLPVQGFNNREFLRRSQSYFATHEWKPAYDLYRLVPPSLMREIKEHYDVLNEQFRLDFFPERNVPLFRSKIPDDYALLDAGERVNGRSIELLLNYFLDLKQLQAAPMKGAPRLVETVPGETDTASADAEPAEPPRRRWFGF